MAIKYPDILKHNNPAYALMESSELRGGAMTVTDKAERDLIPIDKRQRFMIVSYLNPNAGGIGITRRYKGSDVSDIEWVKEENWEKTGAEYSYDLLDMPNELDIANSFHGYVPSLNSDKSAYELKPVIQDDGFVDRENIVISYDYGTNTLTLTALVNFYSFITHSGLGVQRTTDSLVIIPVSGLMYIYYDDEGVLTQVNNLNRDEQWNYMLDTLPVSYLEYNGVDIVHVGDYLKGLSNSELWVKNFFDIGIRRLNGILATDLTFGDGSIDADARFGLSAGTLIFTDRNLLVQTRLSTDTWFVAYFNSSLLPQGFLDSLFPVLTDIDLGIGVTGRLVYNNNGNPAVVNHTNFVWYFVAINNEATISYRTVTFMGNGQFLTQGLAENDLSTEIGTIETQIKIKQGLTIQYAVLYQTNTTYGNAVKAKIVSFVDIIKEGVISTPVPIIPADLINGSDASYLHNHQSITMKWKGNWIQSEYYLNDVVKDGDLTMIANKTTNERPSPQFIGDPFFVYKGVSPITQVTAKQVIFGNRYTFVKGEFLKGYRVYAIIGNHYNIYVVNDPLGLNEIKWVISFTAIITGWKEFNLSGILIQPGYTFDVLAIVREPDPSPVIITANYNYITPPQLTVPLNGQIIHANSNTDLLVISALDNDGTDRHALLNGLSIGDIIEAENNTWIVQLVVDNTTYFNIAISPSSQMTPDGITVFKFETIQSTPITYLSDLDYWLTIPHTIKGLLGIDTAYGDIIPNDTAYGIDITIQEATISNDWELIAISGSSGSGGSGEELENFGLVYGFNSAITDIDPTEGKFLLFGSTALNISKTMFTNIDVSPQLSNISLDTLILFYKKAYSAINKSYIVTGAIIDNGTYYTIPILLNEENGVMDENAEYSLLIQIKSATIQVYDNEVDLSADIIATITAGGISVGDTFTTADNLRTMFLALIAPYVKSILSNITINPVGPVEVGEIITVVSATVTWVDDSEDAVPYNAVITGPGFAGVILTVSPQTVNATVSTTVQKITNTSQAWVFSGEDKDGNALTTKTRYIQWYYKWFFGGSSVEIVDDTTAQSVIDALRYTSLLPSKNNTVTAAADEENGSNYTYIIYAAIFGDIAEITHNGSAPVLGAFTKLTDRNYTNAQGQIVSMSIYKSNATGALITGDTLKIE